MKKNMGLIDRIIRLVLIVIAIVLLMTKAISGWLAIVVGIIAIILLLTSIVGFCPLYGPLGISTKKKDE